MGFGRHEAELESVSSRESGHHHSTACHPEALHAFTAWQAQPKAPGFYREIRDEATRRRSKHHCMLWPASWKLNYSASSMCRSTPCKSLHQYLSSLGGWWEPNPLKDMNRRRVAMAGIAGPLRDRVKNAARSPFTSGHFILSSPVAVFLQPPPHCLAALLALLAL
ncbi:hypothetical protein CLAIMM_14954 [Cladophialophora immunda]|nr:hypothetical protein CLAIMM_14954 [Cladophialophora immunda]